MRSSWPAVRVTGLSFLLSHVLLLVSCTGVEESKSADEASAPGDTAPAAFSERKEVHAPVESVEVIVRESAPPQYVLRVVSGLPSGCAKFSRIEHAREGDTVDVTVWNTVPASDDVMCTMIYGTADNSVTLEGDFGSGRTFEVKVNGEVMARFTAQ